MELEEEIELNEDMCEIYRYMYFCKACALFDCSMEELKKNRVV